jgi:hypothetical protein
MRKTILTLLGSVLLVASVAQAASATTPRHHGRKIVQAPASAIQQFRDSSASVWTAEPDYYSGYYSHGFSAPAGH